MKRVIAVLGVVGVLLVGLSATALSQTTYPPPSGPTCGTTPSTVSPGEQATISGANWEQDSEVRVHSRRYSTNDAGGWTATYSVPADSDPGRRTVVVKGLDQAGNPASCTISLTVNGSSPSAASTRLRVTAGAATAGVLLLGVGTWIVVGRRRRKALTT